MSHAGKWTAHLRLADRDVIRKLLSSNIGPELIERLGGLEDLLKRGKLPYQLIVHARSNLAFSATLRQKSLEPGATLDLGVRLTEYGVPHRGIADVRAEITRPDGSEVTVTLASGEPGAYAAALTAGQPGIYRARILAVGSTSAGHAFTREKTMTATIFAGGDKPRIDPVPDGGGDEGRDFYCRLLDCLLRDASVQRWLKRQELDAKALRKCVQTACRTADAKAGAAKPGSARDLSRLDIGRFADLVRRELMAAEPAMVIAEAAAPVKRDPPDEAVKRRAKKDLKEPFQPTDKARKRMKNASSKSGSPKKGK